MDHRKYGRRQMKTYGKKTTTNSYFNPIFLGASSQQIEHGVVKDAVVDRMKEESCVKLQATRSDAATFVPGRPQSSATLPTKHEERLSPRKDDTPDAGLSIAFKELNLEHGGDTAGPECRQSPVLQPRSHNVQPIPPSSSAEKKPELNPRPTPARPNAASSVAAKSLRTKVSQGSPAKVKHGSVVDRVDKQHQPGPETQPYDPAVESPLPVKRTTRNQVNRPDQHSHIRPLLEFATDVSDRRSPGNFQHWADELDEHLEVEKIAEASYGEVYKLRAKSHAAGSRSDFTHESVLKVLPLKPRVVPRTTKTDHMSAVDDVLVEARTLMRMSSIPGFTNLRDIRVMQGQFPKQFIRAWKAYLQNGAESYFPDPSKARAYPKSQLWVVIEMENAGKDLERFPLRSPLQTWDIFWSVALAIAKGEDLARFEHRDLHLGNICVRETGQKDAGPENDRNVGRTGLKATIIDYTLSRADMETGAGGSDGSPVAFLDLDKDPCLFEAHGDYQYDIYRYMKSAIYHDDPTASLKSTAKPSGERGWHRYQPLTNALWLHFVLTALRKQLACATDDTALPWSSDRSGEDNLVATCERRLAALEADLDPRNGPVASWWTARGVVHYALRRGWLDERDVVECD